MNIEVLTKEDLQVFRKELLRDLQSLLSIKAATRKEWLRSNEVRKFLKISPGTLQHMRETGKLRPSKVGGIFFYRHRDIENLLDGGKEGFPE